MKRWQDECNVSRRAWKTHRLMHVEANNQSSIGYASHQREPGSDPHDVDCGCDEQIGRFRKRDAYDCGRPKCLICHGDKFPRRTPTNQEKVAQLRFNEQLRELFIDE